ncbi:MAG: hypothetical protein WCI93_00640 [bacterium]
MKKEEISKPKGEEIKRAKIIAKGTKCSFLNALKFSRLAKKIKI